MSRSSSVPSTSQPKPSLAPMSLTPSQQILLQKQQEHAGLQALREASADLLARAEKLAEMSHVMADGGEAIGSVLRNWPHVFSILNLFDRPPTSPTSRGGTPLSHDDEPQEPLPQVVRLQYSDEQPIPTERA